DFVASDVKYTKKGSTFTVVYGGKNYRFSTVLLGRHNITNILLGIAIAVELGIDMKKIVKNVSGVRQVEHRLEVRQINGMTFIDDAFNSNPAGSKMALDVLEMMDGNRVIVTPGMIDLGEKQSEINREFGRYMKDRADYVLLVGRKQTAPIMEGLKDAGFDEEKVLVFDDVKQAFGYVYAHFTPKDTILLENDLPDAFSV
ncbi:MAG: UDP-N-acetylmuramoyl-tripeptide--D-alanyl-D-alanine ligase, partial [Erysipelotrichaceae bacterium]|nr:UDP-N-acetylmuramoyl-tripeptide--D-alanyl-D-alanine ligase [Erysipelotrichaceae bacterium]